MDDEPLTLQGLRRMLRSSREIWDMTFAESGAQALDLLSQSRFDIIVSDMLMPGMNGAELLSEVRSRHPTTVRFVLSGHAERNLVLQSANSAHQFLAKPCQPEVLKARVARAAALAQSIRHDEPLRQALTQMDRFPSVPSLYIDFVEQLLTDDGSVETIKDYVLKDIGLAALLLKLVNSAFFGVARECSNANEALELIGLDTLKSLVFSVSAVTSFDGALYRKESLEQIWVHSLNVAAAAKRIAQVENASDGTVNAAFFGGLFHDIGKFLFALYRNEPFQQAKALAADRRIELWVAEQELMVVSHADAGGYLLGLWGLPSPVVESVAWHHTPAKSGTNGFSALTAVHAANVLVHRRDQIGNDIPVPEIDSDYLNSTGLNDRMTAWTEVIEGD